MRRARLLIASFVVGTVACVGLIVVLNGCASRSMGPLHAADGSAPPETSVDAEADLALTMKLETGGAIAAGDRITYLLGVANDGPDDAQSVVLTETLCCGLTHQAIDGAGWVCEDGAQGVVCELGQLSAGQASTLTAVIRAPEEPMTVWAAAEVSSGTPDPDRRNNGSQFFLLVAEPGADLWLRKRTSADSVAPGDVFSYTITVRNGGPEDAEGAVVTDTLPAPIALRGIEASQGTCSGTVCALGPLPLFGRAVITLTATAPVTEGVYVNTAAVRSQMLDQYLGNNAAYVRVQVRKHAIYLPAILR